MKYFTLIQILLPSFKNMSVKKRKKKKNDNKRSKHCTIIIFSVGEHHINLTAQTIYR